MAAVPAKHDLRSPLDKRELEWTRLMRAARAGDAKAYDLLLRDLARHCGLLPAAGSRVPDAARPMLRISCRKPWSPCI